MYYYHFMHGKGLISDQASFLTTSFPCRIEAIDNKPKWPQKMNYTKGASSTSVKTWSALCAKIMLKL
ncbi:hypothetical protein Lal_00042303 [Lupinus albus]|nr:hypothetical protein Lal_00042303 [Lupinus albus]